MGLLNFFQFSQASWLMLLGRFLILLVGTGLLTYLVALILVQIGKDKKHELGYTNFIKQCFMWGINATIAFLGVIVILTIRFNGLYYFSMESLSWSWYCGWLLMTPEMLLMIGWVTTYWYINSYIKKTINY